MRGERYFLSRPMMSVMLVTGLTLLGAGRAEAVDPPHLDAAKVESLDDRHGNFMPAHSH